MNKYLIQYEIVGTDEGGAIMTESRDSKKIAGLLTGMAGGRKVHITKIIPLKMLYKDIDSEEIER